MVPGAPRVGFVTERVPASMLDLDEGRVGPAADEPDLHLGRVRAVAPQVPEIGESTGRLPDRHLAPLVLDAGSRAFVDPTAAARLEDDGKPRLSRDRVVGRPPRPDPPRPDLE